MVADAKKVTFSGALPVTGLAEAAKETTGGE
jgi:hypothetical protein